MGKDDLINGSRRLDGKRRFDFEGWWQVATWNAEMLELLSKIEKREGCIRVFRFDHLLSSEFEAQDGLDTRDSLGWGRLHYVALWNDVAKV